MQIRDGKSAYSKAETERLIAELKDPEKVTVYCGIHKYVPSTVNPPAHQCQECWQAYLVKLVGQLPPHERQGFLEALQEFAHETVQNHEKGIEGYKQFDHVQISYE